MTLQAIQYTRGAPLRILDQKKLPHQTVYLDLNTVQDAWNAIRDMNVRGAPAIAIVAALSLARVLSHHDIVKASAHTHTLAYINQQLDHLVTARPTAVNLLDAVTKLKAAVAAVPPAADDEVLRAVYINSAEQMLVDDVRDNKNIGRHGSAWLRAHAGLGDSPFAILTHCNTGSLATAGYGTALGIIRSLYADGLLKHAYCTETRPYNQGSRLTAYELVYENIPATLVTDSMAAALMRMEPSIRAVVVGADRVAANGDTANKIGTYSLAVLARQHGVKFVVAAPTTSIDLHTASGEAIVIEQRPPGELVAVRGNAVRADGSVDTERVETVSTAAAGIGVWNPSFDVTPASLIDAIVTEKGVFEKGPDGVFDLKG